MKSKIINIVLALLLFAQPVLALQNFRHGSRELPNIAITIDDCYDKEVYAGFLDVAKEYGAKLTFFVSGIAIKPGDKALFERTFTEGHEIGSHGWRHRDYYRLTPEQSIQEQKMFEALMAEALGYAFKPKFIRFPYGNAGSGIIPENYYRACKAMGYEYIVNWDVQLDSLASMLSRTQNGSILLFHTNREDLQRFRELAPLLVEKGYHMTSLSEVLGLED